MDPTTKTLRIVTAAVDAIAILLLFTTVLSAADPFQRRRELMVRRHIQSEGVDNESVLHSMRTTPRHEFLSADKRELAYYDMAVPIGHGQTISPPYVVAFMTAQLDPQPTDRVLEIGTGSGYQAAVLSPLVAEVYTIEIVVALGQRAAETLQRLKYKNVFTKIGDGFQGWPERAPFDKIIVTCSPEDIPKPLIDQLADGGQIIIPVGERFHQTLCRFKKSGGRLEREPLQATFFVPMTGHSETQREIKPDLSDPSVVNGSFETVLEGSSDPESWYYLREARVQESDSAPDGEHVMVFTNSVLGRSSHVLQAFGVDGLLVNHLSVELMVTGQRIRSGRQPDQAARTLVQFYGENREPVGHATLGPWRGTFRWKKVTKRVRVPADARLAVIGVGLWGSTGTLSIDQVSIQSR